MPNIVMSNVCCTSKTFQLQSACELEQAYWQRRYTMSFSLSGWGSSSSPSYIMGSSFMPASSTARTSSLPLTTRAMCFSIRSGVSGKFSMPASQSGCAAVYHARTRTACLPTSHRFLRASCMSHRPAGSILCKQHHATLFPEAMCCSDDSSQHVGHVKEHTCQHKVPSIMSRSTPVNMRSLAS